MKVVGYMRVSTDGQVGEDKFGIASQMSQIELYCRREGHEIIGWYKDEGKSGASEDRPEFDKIIYGEVMNPPVEAVVVAKSDRVARDINIYFYYKHELLKKGMKLISVSEDFGAMGEFASIMEAFVQVIAEMERKNITKRTTGGRMIKARQGGYAGGRVPYGYKSIQHKWVINEAEAEAVRRIFAYPEIGDHRMAMWLNRAGYPARSKNGWSKGTIHAIRSNELIYRGMYDYQGIVVQGQHEPILKDDEMPIWEKEDIAAAFTKSTG